MAKKATSKPAARAAKSAAVPPALPTSNESVQPGAEQGMATPLSPEGVTVLATAETPPGAFGGLPPVVPSSKTTVTDPAGDAYEEGDIPPEIVVGSELAGGADEPTVGPTVELSEPIRQAQSYITPHGVPESGHQHYYTPPPPDLRSKKKANR